MYDCNSSGGYSARSLAEGDNSPRYSIAPVFSQPTIAYNSPGVPHGDSTLYAHTSSEKLDKAVKNHHDQSSGMGLPSPRMPAYVSESLPRGYVPNSARGTYVTSPKPHSLFIANDFLAPGSTARFVGDSEEVREFVQEAFQATTGDEMPQDIQITVLNDKEFIRAHLDYDATTNDGVQGFSLNANGAGVNKIFVRANPIDKLMLTIGHEIGHVLTQTLQNAHDEEAKAFAFSLAWMEAVKEHNIAGIGAHILPTPAENGLHDQAFAFVQKLVSTGINSWEAFLQLAKGTFTITNQIETVEV